MEAENRENLAHSADVQMQLSVNGHVLTIGHIGPDYVILDHPIDQPPSEAEISMSVDTWASQWPVVLPNGIRERRVPIRRM